MTTTTISTSEFAAAVRAALADLPADELDELTDGLEADLAERADESGADLGDPVAYAEELRAAAGYPPRPARGHLGDTLPDLRTLPQEVRRRWDAALTRLPLLASVVAFLVALRPVWWVLRALALYFIAVSALGFGMLGPFWPVAVALIVVSVQVGRGRMQRRVGARWLQRAASAIAIVALPMIAGWLATQVNLGISSSYMYEPEVYLPSGVTSNGAQVDNIFAYDAAGEPIDQVQLFDQDGRPLDLTSDTSARWWDAADGSILVPSDDVPGRAGWNVYPLGHVDSWQDVEDGLVEDDEVAPAEFPHYLVKPLAD